METSRSSTRCPTLGLPWLPVAARSLRTWVWWMPRSSAIWVAEMISWPAVSTRIR